MCKDKMYVREHVTVMHEAKSIELTIYLSETVANIIVPYVILYMHGNSSCRVEALGLMKTLRPGISLACFDFIGCGKN